MKPKIKKTYKEIKDLKIQGATNVALAAIDAVKEAEDKKELKESIEYLKTSRPTEPLMRNGLKYVEKKFKEGEDVEKAGEEFKKIVEGAVDEIIEMGAEFLPHDTTVMTHCHSSLVEGIVKRAHELGKIERITVTETRPLYQGRITAKNLSEAGLPVTIVVDSATREILRESDLALVGADVITSDGHLYNKIGTSELALSAEESSKEFMVASQLLKLDPVTLKGKREEVEERPKEEVWENPPEKVEVRNPAFDATPPKYINYMITEEGIINPSDVIDNARRIYPWIFE